MFKKLLLLPVVVSILSLPAQARSDDEITLLAIPRETVPLQIGQDISRRYPVLLVSYQMVRGDLQIHAWDGDNWIFVPVEDYTSGTFFANRPKTAIIVENEKMHAPDVLTPGSLWCESARRLTSTDPRVMLHLLGLSFDFPFRHWNQFAKRYGYELEEINPSLENVYWWHLQGNVLMEKRAKRDFSIDLPHWQPLDPIPAPPVESVIETEKSAVEVPAEPESTAVDITVKAAEKPAAAPAVEPAPEIQTTDQPTAEEPVEEEGIEPSPIIETAPAELEIPAEIPSLKADPFSEEEVPAAEIIIPAEPKRAWWKIF